MVDPSDFDYHEEPVPAPNDGQVLVRTLYVSFDPAMRAFLQDRPSYVPPQPVGEVMRAGAIGQVIKSRSAGFAVGDLLLGSFGWQDYALFDGGRPGAVKISGNHPLPTYLGVLGGTGLTAYFGLLEVGKVTAADTVVVSGAAGATGSSAVQIARILGCRTIGIAGGAEKCRWLTNELGAEAAIDYKSEDVAARLAHYCPDGIDLYFDNVGGSILEAAIGKMKMKGRIALCGMISGYNDDQPQPGPSNLFELVARQVRMEGFLAYEFVARFDEARREMEGWMATGQLRSFEDIQEGFENIPKTFMRIFAGDNIGKQMLKIADPT
jgi:NADPH-dependent curcumin reductase CurA